MGSKVINQQSYHDGRVVLYQLEDRPKGLWLCRLKLPKTKGYVYRGTGSSDLYEARKFADDLLDELRFNPDRTSCYWELLLEACRGIQSNNTCRLDGKESPRGGLRVFGCLCSPIFL